MNRTQRGEFPKKGSAGGFLPAAFCPASYSEYALQLGKTPPTSFSPLGEGWLPAAPRRQVNPQKQRGVGGV